MLKIIKKTKFGYRIEALNKTLNMVTEYRWRHQLYGITRKKKRSF